MASSKTSKLGGLIVINAALLATLALVVLTPSPEARGQGPGMSSPAARARGAYTMVGGRVTGQPESAIYIVDAANQELLALKWDRSRKQLKGLGYMDLAASRRQGDNNARGR